VGEGKSWDWNEEGKENDIGGRNGEEERKGPVSNCFLCALWKLKY